jgi:hypothetical protein
VFWEVDVSIPYDGLFVVLCYLEVVSYGPEVVGVGFEFASLIFLQIAGER